jgi:hypothetical protein
MRCIEVKNSILDYIENEIDKIKKRNISKHLRKCKDCRTMLLHYKKVLKLSKSIKVEKPDEKFWINFLPNVRYRLQKRKSILNILRPIVAFSTILVLLLIIFYPKTINKSKEVVSTYNFDENKIIEQIITDENGLWVMLDEIYLKVGKIKEGLNVLPKEERDKILEELTLDYIQGNI